jgi:hypothetical protein
MGLLDRRADNGTSKFDEQFLTRLYELVRARPPQFGWLRPTWTRELLVQTMVRETGVQLTFMTVAIVGNSPIVYCGSWQCL